MGMLRLYVRVLGLLAPDRRLAIGLGLANILAAGLLFIEPVLFGRVIDVLSRAAGMTHAAVWSESRQLLVIWGIAGLAGIITNVSISLLSDRMAHRNRLALMNRYFAHVLSLPLSFHGDIQSGRLMKVMLAGTDNLFGLWLAFFREHMATFIAAIVLLPLTLILNWRLALVLLVLIVLFAVVTAFVIRKTERAQGQVERFQSQLAGNAQDALSNVVVVQSFTRLSAEARVFDDIMRQVLRHQFPVLNWWAVVSVLTRAASTITVIAIFVMGTVLHLRGQATVGEIVSFMGFATMLIGRMDQASGFVSRIFFQMPALADFFRVLDSQSTVPDKPNGIDIGRAKGDVEFDDINFSYDGKRPALVHFSLKVPAGTTMAFVGPTGAGKSTALSLLHRMWDAQSGVIRVDGIDTRDIKLESLRRNIGVVFQDSTMFFRSIADNLCIGKPDATQAELEAAAKLAEAHDFIMRQPNGYETMVGERGATLSGGERQRLAIARALLKDPPILILDEATSALDSVTEARIQRAFETLMAGRTTFIIAHRLSTIRKADIVVVFEHGRVVEQGSYDALVAQDGPFARLVATQQAGIESA